MKIVHDPSQHQEDALFPPLYALMGELDGEKQLERIFGWTAHHYHQPMRRANSHQNLHHGWHLEYLTVYALSNH